MASSIKNLKKYIKYLQKPYETYITDHMATLSNKYEYKLKHNSIPLYFDSNKHCIVKEKQITITYCWEKRVGIC